jgi:hypothetical protein
LGEKRDPRRIIVELYEDPSRQATENEIETIRAHLLSAEFKPDIRVPAAIRGLSASGHTLGTREDSLVTHLVQRVALDEQWAEGTTPREYLMDLRAAIRDDSARFGVGKPEGNAAPLVYVFANNPTPPERRSRNSEPVMFVLYGVADDVIITGHMASSADAVRKARDFRWLR